MKTHESIQHTGKGKYTELESSNSVIGWCVTHFTIVQTSKENNIKDNFSYYNLLISTQ